MPIGSRYNGGGSIQGVVIEGQVDAGGSITPVSGGSSSSPQYVTAAQNTPTFTSIAVVAATAGDLFAADANRHGARLLNYTASPIYFAPTSLGATPASGAPSDVVPAAAAGLPGQYEFPYAPTVAYRYIGAGAGSGLTALVTEVW